MGITVEALRRRPRTEAEKLTAKELGVDISGLRQRRYRYRKRTGI